MLCSKCSKSCHPLIFDFQIHCDGLDGVRSLWDWGSTSVLCVLETDHTHNLLLSASRFCTLYGSGACIKAAGSFFYY